MKDYTVTLAGPERHDGEKPYTYVVQAESPDDAWEKVKAVYVEERYLPGEVQDVVRVEVVEGVPGPDVWYHWNDLRPKWIVHDWAGNVKFRGKLFDSFEDGWEYIRENVPSEEDWQEFSVDPADEE